MVKFLTQPAAPAQADVEDAIEVSLVERDPHSRGIVVALNVPQGGTLSDPRPALRQRFGEAREAFLASNEAARKLADVRKALQEARARHSAATGGVAEAEGQLVRLAAAGADQAEAEQQLRSARQVAEQARERVRRMEAALEPVQRQALGAWHLERNRVVRQAVVEAAEAERQALERLAAAVGGGLLLELLEAADVRNLLRDGREVTALVGTI